MKTYFISDLHLDATEPNNIQAFLDFTKKLSNASDTDALYILGDLFEYWLGDDSMQEITFHPLQAVVDALRKLSEQGIPLYFVKGNRDFLIGDIFSQTTGMTLLDDELCIDVYGKRLLIMHGDTLCIDDTEYQQLRTVLRDPTWQQMFLSKPLSERVQIAQHLRQQSKQKTANKREAIMDVNPSKVLEVMDDYQVHTLIHGHTHRVAAHQFSQHQTIYQRFVLSDWHGTAQYLCVTPNSITFQSA